jgi:hypothetical protein
MPHPSQNRRKPRLRRVRLSHGSTLLVLVTALAGCSGAAPRDVVTRSSVPDAEGDVVVGGLGKDRETVTAAPGNTITDIITTTVDHGADVVTIDVAFNDLRPGQYLDLSAYVTTDSTGSRLPTQATALTYLGDSSIDIYYEGDPPSRCNDAAVAIDYDINTLTMSIPRRCLGEPRWIELEVRAATMRYEATGPRRDAVWEDDAYRTSQDQPAGGQTSGRLHHP